MNSKAKPSKLKARLPRGLSDRGPAEIAATRRMLDKIREVYERYGFEPVETPAFEYTDALGKFLPDQDRPNEGVFSFQDDDEQWLSLRYDLTAPLARYVAENFQHLALPYRSYRYGWVFRNEKPGPGRFRQFMQFDADTVGSASPAADAEMCMMAADTMEALGIPRGSYVVKVNNSKVLDGVLEAINLGGPENAGRRLTVLRAIDKLDRLRVEGVRQLLGEGRKDESGDFTKGAGLTGNQIERVLAYVRAATMVSGKTLSSSSPPPAAAAGRYVLRRRDADDPDPSDYWYEVNNQDTINKLRGIVGDSPLATAGLDELSHIANLTAAGNYGDGQILIDPSVVRGLEYYTGPVFEVELTFPIEDEKGNPVRFGSVGGGGRYDGLVSRFMGQPVPATGFSIGVSRLLAALQHLKKVEQKPAPGPVVVTVFDRDRLADYQRLVQMLRAAPLDLNRLDGPRIRAELYLGNPKNFGNQLKYADRRHAPCVVIQGGDERGNPNGPHVVVKDLVLGSELSRSDSSAGRDEHLQRQAEAQRLVPESDLVGAVRAVLARHNVSWD